jgi:hypothetical protein
MGRHGAVLGYRWIGWRDPEYELRGHVMILLFWGRLVCPMLFHDPTAPVYRAEHQDLAAMLDAPVVADSARQPESA